MRRAVAAFVLGAILAVAAPARADDDDADDEPSPVAFVYTTPVDKNYLRAVSETFGALIFGYVWYLYTTSNAADWDMSYSWGSLKAKLVGDAVRFDTNRYDTNMIAHPVSGWAFYVGGRSNRVNVLEATIFSAVASTLWETIGELREQASVNDLVVTPIGGAVLGEAATQLGAFFDRSRRSWLTELLGIVFDPLKKAHDFVDGASPARSPEVDGLGFSADEGHAFDVAVGGGVTRQSKATRPLDADWRIAAHAELANVPGWHRTGRRSGYTLDANFTFVDLETTSSRAGLSDVRFLSRVAPVAYYRVDIEREPGGPPRGSRWYLGATAGFDYDYHVWDRGTPGIDDRISSVHLGGADVRYEAFFGSGLRLRASLHAHPGFAAVTSGTTRDYLQRGGDPGRLPSVAREQMYYYGWSVDVASSVELAAERWGVGAMTQLDTYRGVDGLDRRPETVHDPVRLADERVFARAAAWVAPVRGLRVSVALDERALAGQTHEARSTQDETSVAATLSGVF